MIQLESVLLFQFLLYEQQKFSISEICGIFGANGSGKSSALDAIQIAMFGANKNLHAFNAQAESGGKHQERTLRSYCLGQFGGSVEQSVRDNATTYITLIWRDTETKEPISMGICIEASKDSETERVLGRYVIRGVELAMIDHQQVAADGRLEPTPWSTFRHRLLERAKVTGEDPLFEDASSYVRQVLFALRGKVGQSSADAFARAFRFALRMKFDKSIDQIVRDDVLEQRRTNIQKFKAIVDGFRALNESILRLEKRISRGKEVSADFDKALEDARKNSTWRALEADADHEGKCVKHDTLAGQLSDAEEKARSTRKEAETTAQQWQLKSSEVAHLKNLLESHQDHAANANAQADRETAENLADLKSKAFRSAIADLGRLAKNSSAQGGDEKWADLLGAIGQRFQQILASDAAPDVDFLRNALADLGRVATDASRHVEKELSETKDALIDAKQQIKLLEPALDRVRTGRAPLSIRTQTLINEFQDNGLNPTPVCDLVRVTAPEWQPAIEAYLASNLEALLLPHEEEDKAFGIYRNMQGKRAIYGVKIVRSVRSAGLAPVHADKVASLIDGKDKHAVDYLRSKLGSLKLATSKEEALGGERALTIDGMLVGPKDFERLELVSSADLKIGGGEPAQQVRLEQELTRFRKIERDAAAREIKLNGLKMPLQRMSSEQTIELLENHFGALVEATRSVELAHQRLNQSSSAEYQSLVEKHSSEKALIPGLEQVKQKAHHAAMQAEFVIPGLQEKVEDSANAVTHSEQRRAQCRADLDFDPVYSPEKWEELLEEFDDNYAGMVAKAQLQVTKYGQRLTNSASAAQSKLGSYLSEMRDVFIPEDQHKDWRKAKEWMENEIQRLESAELVEQKEQAQAAYNASLQTFRQDVAIALSTNLKAMRDTFDRLNMALRSTPAFTNGERYRFVWDKRPDLVPLLNFINSVADYGADGNLFGEPGDVPAQFEELLRDKVAVGGGASKSPLDDYREFFTYDIVIEVEDEEGNLSKKGNLSNFVGPGSGGEHRAPLYVIAGAALYSAYRMDKNNRDGLRLIMLDEVFVKMDTSNIVATMRYLQELGLQVLLASPGENLPILTAFLHSYYEIMKDPIHHSIETQERGVSEEMREQFKADLWEFNPELLDEEIRRLRPQPPTPGGDVQWIA
jgi:chromosome segregation protein